MSVEYSRPRFVCCRADRRKRRRVRECAPPTQRLSPSVRWWCRHRRPPTAQRTTPWRTTPLRFFPGHASRWRRRKFHRRKFWRKKFSTFQKILYCAVCHYLWTFRRTVLECSLWLLHPPRDIFKSAAGHTLPLDPREKRKR